MAADSLVVDSLEPGSPAVAGNLVVEAHNLVAADSPAAVDIRVAAAGHNMVPPLWLLRSAWFRLAALEAVCQREILLEPLRTPAPTRPTPAPMAVPNTALHTRWLAPTWPFDVAPTMAPRPVPNAAPPPAPIPVVSKPLPTRLRCYRQSIALLSRQLKLISVAPDI